jgi:hypothetical protein
MKYEPAEIEVINFTSEDIITDSNCTSETEGF